ncbi:hypothetical protein AB0F18_13010 [Streptomyces sp. NPDC029216]|uniref:hypothetical protein n=1 Tax=Streptomyces sp. NPDC029216 TaxID=3154701 RepID=UPI00340B1D82
MTAGLQQWDAALPRRRSDRARPREEPSGSTSRARADGTSGVPLWQLPDPAADRIAPEVTALWHGRVYGKTRSGTVALDARTGADLPTRPGTAPDLVNGYTAIALATTTTTVELMAYQTAE